jgi:hypothetical protein
MKKNHKEVTFLFFIVERDVRHISDLIQQKATGPSKIWRFNEMKGTLLLNKGSFVKLYEDRYSTSVPSLIFFMATISPVF